MLSKAARQPTYKGFLAFCRALDEPLDPFEREIAKLHFGPEREAVVILPRGNYKTTMAARLGLHHLITVPNAEVTIGATNREQAKICFERMKGYGLHPALDGIVTARTLEIRAQSQAEHFSYSAAEAILKVVPGDGAKAHGLSSSLYIGDEIWAWRGEAELLEAMQTGLIKRPDAKFLAISTAAAKLNSPLGRLRERAMSQANVKVSADGIKTESHGKLAWLEWSLPETAELDDFELVKKCNPAKNITVDGLERQYESISRQAFAQFHCNRWGSRDGAWLPAGSWQECAGNAEIEAGETIWAGVDIGGTRSNSAVVFVTKDLRVNCRTWIGNEAPLEVASYLETLARRYDLREVAYDPFRFMSEAQRLEAAGLLMVEFPQFDSRMVPASEKLYAAVAEGKLTHGNQEDLNTHVANAIAKSTERGWRLSRNESTGGNIDAAVALAMAIDRAGQKAERSVVLGFIG